MRIISLFFLLIIILVVTGFTMLNTELIEIKYLIGTTKLPLAVICFVALAVGMLLGIISMLAKVANLKKQNYLLRVQLKSAIAQTSPTHIIPKNG